MKKNEKITLAKLDPAILAAGHSMKINTVSSILRPSECDVSLNQSYYHDEDHILLIQLNKNKRETLKKNLHNFIMLCRNIKYYHVQRCIFKLKHFQAEIDLHENLVSMISN